MQLLTDSIVVGGPDSVQSLFVCNRGGRRTIICLNYFSCTIPSIH